MKSLIFLISILVLFPFPLRASTTFEVAMTTSFNSWVVEASGTTPLSIVIGVEVEMDGCNRSWITPNLLPVDISESTRSVASPVFLLDYTVPTFSRGCANPHPHKELLFSEPIEVFPGGASTRAVILAPAEVTLIPADREQASQIRTNKGINASIIDAYLKTAESGR